MVSAILFILAGAGIIAVLVYGFVLSRREAGPPPLAPEQAAPLFELKVDELARAIATAEGFFVPGSLPNRANNPGSLGPMDTSPKFPVVNARGSQVSMLPNVELGWEFLKKKIRRMLRGESRVFSLDDTFWDLGFKYVGGSQFPEDAKNWTRNVTRRLGVDPDLTLREWLSK